MLRVSFALVAILGAASISQAQIATENVPSVARIFAFLSPPPSGVTTAAIIFDPASGASMSEAAQIEKALAEGLVVGSARLVPKRVSIASLANLRGVRVAFVTRGLHAHYTEIGAASRGLLTITTDRDCVVAGKCVVGVSSGAQTEIIVSRTALRAAGIRFGAMFAMLAKEI